MYWEENLLSDLMTKHPDPELMKFLDDKLRIWIFIDVWQHDPITNWKTNSVGALCADKLTCVRLSSNLHSIYGCVAGGILHANKQDYFLKIYGNIYYFYTYAVISIYFHSRYGVVTFPPPCIYKHFLRRQKYGHLKSFCS